jgi:endonuclease/exonuclease/phosphatase family metal-dependent hydrolase
MLAAISHMLEVDMHTVRTRAAAALVVLALAGPVAALAQTRRPKRRPPSAPAPSVVPLLTYNELVTLYERLTPPAALRAKMHTILTTPFVANDAWAKGARPRKPSSGPLGPSLRVAMWNIERGLELDKIKLAFTDPDRLVALAAEETARAAAAAAEEGKKEEVEPTDPAAALDEARALADADVVLLNEVDWGMGRTDYRNVAAELAETLGMNYAYGVEFLEVDPVSMGRETFAEMPPEERAELVANTRVDPERYKGMHGSAILSRYRLENVRLVPYTTAGYDWYTGEKRPISPLEKGKRKASEQILLETVSREVRRGGRMMLVAEIADEAFPKGRATIVCTHTEDKTKPKNRVAQLDELLALVGSIDHPVIVGGDMNTNGSDLAPTSLKRELKRRYGSKDFWIKKGVFMATGVGLVGSLLIGGANKLRTLNDPTVRDVRFVASNPEAKFFTTLEEYRFRDGTAFDFRGDHERSTGGRSGSLANSNERAEKGFVPTFAVERTIGKLGEFKIDWIFVRSTFLKDEDDEGQPYRFAPHFGRTLRALNYAFPDRISDHNPLLVDLPFGEPAARR